jgi:hypothetical protein
MQQFTANEKLKLNELLQAVEIISEVEGHADDDCEAAGAPHDFAVPEVVEGAGTSLPASRLDDDVVDRACDRLAKLRGEF